MLVVGSGVAGLFGALCAASDADVFVLSKGTILASTSSLAQGGIAAAVGPGDSPHLHAQDTLAAGRGLCRASAVRVLTELRDKVGAMPSAPGPALPRRGQPSMAEDAVSALVNLGYRRPEAQPAVAGAVERLGDAATLDVVIRDCLQQLAQRAPG